MQIKRLVIQHPFRCGILVAMVKKDLGLIEELLNRSIDTIYPTKEELKKKLLAGEQLTVYVGIDPTADYVHLGHSTNYLILERFHKLGHKIIVLVGDFTAMIGDPSDKTSMRVQLTPEQVQENLRTFKEQIGKILPFDDTDNPIEFRFNSDWLSSLTFKDAVELASNFTVQQMIERDAFQKRIKANKPLFVHEFFYPLMQGYDSVAMEVDVELGGTDQTFNMLAGRTLLKRYKDKEKFVISTTLLVNPVTGEKMMSKSLGTGIGLNESPREMFAKVMRLPDEGMVQCFIDCTRLSLEEIQQIETRLKERANPRDIKLQLGREIVTMYHDSEAAVDAEQSWLAQVSQGQLPDDIPAFSAQAGEVNIVDLLLDAHMVASKSEARRAVEQGGLKINSDTYTEMTAMIKDGDVIQLGKRRFIRISTGS